MSIRMDDTISEHVSAEDAVEAPVWYAIAARYPGSTGGETL